MYIGDSAFLGRKGWQASELIDGRCYSLRKVERLSLRVKVIVCGYGDFDAIRTGLLEQRFQLSGFFELSCKSQGIRKSERDERITTSFLSRLGGLFDDPVGRCLVFVRRRRGYRRSSIDPDRIDELRRAYGDGTRGSCRVDMGRRCNL